MCSGIYYGEVKGLVSVERCSMCGRIHYGEVEGLDSVERWSCSRGASCVVRYIRIAWGDL